MRETLLGHTQTCLIDDEDFDLISQYNWYASNSGKKIYAKGFVGSSIKVK